MRIEISVLALLVAGLACGGTSPSATPAAQPAATLHEGEVHLSNLRQLTRDAGENAEAYWSFGGDELIMQSKRPPFACDQIYRLPIDGQRPKLVSTGLGRTTCAYFLPGDKEIVYSSTHRSGGACPPVPDHSQGYVWPIYEEYNIFVANTDGTQLRQLTDSPHYDAEATVCGKDGSIVFTSTRGGDLDLYRMDRDGSNLKQLTDSPGYDGGAFFSPDCSQIVWRASRPKGDALDEYKSLLAKGLVRPSKLELFVANADGTSPRQITYLNAASFAPFFHPSGKRVLFSTNFAGKGGREFDIWAVNTDGTELERITYAEGFDGFPMFSPDGSKLAFSSNRNQANEGETDVFVADWLEPGKGEMHDNGSAAFLRDVQWLADDKREGRGVGGEGIEDSAQWLAKRFTSLGLEPGNGASFFQELKVATSIKRGEKNSLKIGKSQLAGDSLAPLGFSANGRVSAQSIFLGYGIVAKELGLDDYKGKKAKGKIAVVLRYTPDTKAFKDQRNFDLYSSMHRKAFTARENGALALIVINGPAPGDKEEAPMPELTLDRLGEVGIPVLVVSAKAAASLKKGTSKVALEIALERVLATSKNVVARLPAKGQKLLGSVVVGAHYDHLGMGGENSLGDGTQDIHNGADDNASGVAGLLEVARLAAASADRRRDMVFVAFTAEENGLLGSKHFVDTMLESTAPIAMVNMDMIGRLRSNRLSVLGVATAKEWASMVMPTCQRHRVDCVTGGDGYGPSDHSSFTAAGVPVLYFSTGAHADYHKPSDDTETINAIGGKVVSGLIAELALAAGNLATAPVHQKVEAPIRGGDRRAFGASLGTIPDYSGDTSKPGLLLSGARPGGAADMAGMQSGDRILAIGDTEIRSVKDLMYVLQAARPGQEAVARVERAGKTLMLKLVFQKSRARKH
jgi:Tol biopolymer transport system component